MSTQRRKYAERGRSIRQLRSGNYQARYYDGRGIRQSASFPTKQAARAFLDRQSADKQRGTLINPRDGRTTFALAAESWLATRGSLGGKTQANYRGIIEYRINPQFGDRQIGTITASEIVTWLNSLQSASENRSPLSPGTARNILRVMRSVFATAVRDRKVAHNPAAELNNQEKPSYTPADRVPLTAVEVERLAQVFDEIDADNNHTSNFGLLVRFAARSGMRAGELAGLTWSNVDLGKGEVHVRQSVSRVGTTDTLTPPKTRKSRRTIPLGSSLTAMMKAEAARTGARFTPQAYVFGAQADRTSPMTWSRDFYLPHFKAAAVQAGLATSLRFHDLRHTCASLLIRAGIPIESVSAHLGHSSPAITWKVYAHLYADERQQRASLLDAAFGLD
jgi:integrase